MIIVHLSKVKKGDEIEASKEPSHRGKSKRISRAMLVVMISWTLQVWRSLP
jgi:hypothetical protein